mmetsp:Transcript_26305/g.30306  ORF Transcript_26305/g.30306 Transcript_26305/m.30306 type:complete len:388 (-) Transcript_26305:335-1498(-)
MNKHNKKSLSFANNGRPKSMVISMKSIGTIVVVLTVVYLCCMYHMMNMNASAMSSHQSEVLRKQQRELSGKDPAPAVLSSSSKNEEMVANNNKFKWKVVASSVTVAASQMGDSSSPYYVTPTASSHMKTDGKKPQVTGKHAMSVTTLINNTGAPIIVMGMMKAGTTSVFGYFKCGLLKQDQKFLTHYDCNPNIYNRTITRKSCGYQMLINLRNNKNAFDRMDSFALYAEIDGQVEAGMYLPQWTNLHEIHQQFPRATFILNMRNPKQWIKSIDKWQDLRQRFIDLDLGHAFPKGAGKTDAELEAFYLLQAQKVRDFVKEFPSHELVEIDIGSEDTGQIMQDSFGITKDCWGIRNSNPNGNAVWKMLPDHMVQEKEAKREEAAAKDLD